MQSTCFYTLMFLIRSYNCSATDTPSCSLPSQCAFHSNDNYFVVIAECGGGQEVRDTLIRKSQSTRRTSLEDEGKRQTRIVGDVD